MGEFSSVHSCTLNFHCHSHPMFRFPSRHVSPTISPTTPKLVSLHIHNHHPLISVKFNSTTSKAHSFTVSYLVDTCGFSPQRAASLSKRINFETREKPDFVIEFFKNLGFSQTKALTIIRVVPQFLQSNPEKTFLPKIEFFKSKGFSHSDIAFIIIKCPNILKRSLEKEIIPCFDFFDNMFQSMDKFMKVVIRCPGILFDLDKRSAPNIELLREGGVPESQIIRFIEYYPGTLKASPKRFKEMVKEVKELGFNPLRLNFVAALHIKNCISKSTWAKKEGVYRRWGWTDADIRAAFRAHPMCMASSADKIEAVMDYLVNKLGCKSSAIATHPVLVSMSLEKRIIPRGSVILVLLSKGLVNRIYLGAMFGCAESVFLNKYIFCHEKDAGELLKLYQDQSDLAE